MAFINTLYNLWPNGDERMPGLRDGIAVSAADVFKKFGVDTPLLVAHVMAQISHECGAGHDIVENLNYSAQRMPQVWPSRFPTIASAKPFEHNPQALANKVYNGRMGNKVGSNDGWTYRGRGASQTTGKEGYQRVAKATGIDVVGNPDLIINPHFFLLCGVSDFVNCGCLPYAKKDDLVGVSAMLNVGKLVAASKIIGFAERKTWLARWKKALGA
jgi:putative chitinase